MVYGAHLSHHVRDVRWRFVSRTYVSLSEKQSQDGGDGFDRLNAVAMTEDGSCVLAGYTSGEWGGQHNLGGNDFAAVKLDANGIVLWRWQVPRSLHENSTSLVTHG